MKAPLFDANFRGGVCPLSNEQIQTYIDSGEPFGKAGAYGIQGGAAPLFPKSAVVIAVSWVFLYTKLLNS